ncbi:MAG TPA: hypothetical protein VKA84_06135 [Gemmatimonadaceae bacterium]|nr:hypothetical protein [Gemmatimonadaceae bacterium]
MKQQLGSALVCLSLAACVPPQPPAPPVERSTTTVAASFGQTWDAVIDWFATKNIPIRNVERASGLIVAEPMKMGLGLREAHTQKFADCGTDFMGTRGVPTDAIYNVLVRGDSAQSTVRMTVRYVAADASTTKTCSTMGTFETEAETMIKQNAEAKAANRRLTTPP